MASGKRLIDANALQFEPDENGIANNIWVGGRSGGKTMNMILYNLKKMIEYAPTVDAVEVVRCKDCEHRGDDVYCPMCFEEAIEWDDDGYTEVDYVLHDRTTDDGFCDRGERKDGE